MERIAILTNISWTLYNFRLGLAKEIRKAGYEPVLIAAPDKYAKILLADGWNFIPLKNLERTGVNPLKDLMTFIDVVKIYKRYKICCALHYYSKPLIYGNLAAVYLKIPFLPTVAGLGAPFLDSRRFVRQITLYLFKISFLRSKKVVFQNIEDLNFFVKSKIIPRKKAVLIEGSGVDLFKYQSKLFDPPATNQIIFFMFSRLTRLKGVEFYIEAAKEIKSKYTNTEFKLAGTFESDRLAIQKEEILKWHGTGVINYLGPVKNMPEEISKAHVVVLPSFYREGLPKSLIEAAAMSKPIITTDHVGCRQVVEDGVNGFLVPVKNAKALANAFERFIALPESEKQKLGEASRKIAEERFDERIINQQYISLIESIVKKKGSKETKVQECDATMPNSEQTQGQ